MTKRAGAWRAALALAATMACATAPRAQSFAPDDGLRRQAVLDRLGGGTERIGEAGAPVTLVHFFATWCAPCRPELASLDALAPDAAAAGYRIVAVDVGEVDARVARFFADHPVTFAIALDRDRAAARLFAVDSLPTTVALDCAGRARLRVETDLDWRREDIRAALDRLAAYCIP